MAFVSSLVFAAAFVTAVAAIVLTIAPEWTRIVSLLRQGGATLQPVPPAARRRLAVASSRRQGGVSRMREAA